MGSSLLEGGGKMKCKVGDIAMVVCGVQSGIFVTCLSLDDDEHFEHLQDVWKIDKLLHWTDNQNRPYCPDEYLVPVRPKGDLEDVDIYNKLPVKEAV